MTKIEEVFKDILGIIWGEEKKKNQKGLEPKKVHTEQMTNLLKI